MRIAGEAWAWDQDHLQRYPETEIIAVSGKFPLILVDINFTRVSKAAIPSFPLGLRCLSLFGTGCIAIRNHDACGIQASVGEQVIVIKDMNSLC